jgi:uncharacterized membrane protein YtjA (UPF0391 family)
MLRWAVIFFIIAIIAALFGFTEIAGAAAGIAVFLFWAFVILTVIFLILALVPRFGLPGLALAGLVANVLTGVAFYVPAACRLARVQASVLLVKALAQPAAACVPAAVFAYLVSVRFGPLESWPELLAAVGLTGLLALAAILVFSTTRWERSRYLATVRRVVRG